MALFHPISDWFLGPPCGIQESTLPKYISPLTDPQHPPVGTTFRVLRRRSAPDVAVCSHRRSIDHSKTPMANPMIQWAEPSFSCCFCFFFGGEAYPFLKLLNSINIQLIQIYIVGSICPFYHNIYTYLDLKLTALT